MISGSWAQYMYRYGTLVLEKCGPNTCIDLALVTIREGPNFGSLPQALPKKHCKTLRFLMFQKTPRWCAPALPKKHCKTQRFLRFLFFQPPLRKPGAHPPPQKKHSKTHDFNTFRYLFSSKKVSIWSPKRYVFEVQK